LNFVKFGGFNAAEYAFYLAGNLVLKYVKSVPFGLNITEVFFVLLLILADDLAYFFVVVRFFELAKSTWLGIELNNFSKLMKNKTPHALLQM
jgi:hypothetical protein